MILRRLELLISSFPFWFFWVMHRHIQLLYDMSPFILPTLRAIPPQALTIIPLLLRLIQQEVLPLAFQVSLSALPF